MTKEIERVSTGIPGLDELIEGGLVKNSVTLITGSAGTGKTIFCSQFLWEGLKNGENCMFITFEEKPEKIKNTAYDFGWDYEKHEEKGNLFIRHKDPFEATDKEELFWFEDQLERENIDRVTLDSTSVVSLYYNDRYDIRKNVFELTNILQEAGVTTVMTTEAPEGEWRITRFGVEEFLVDGVIVLYYAQTKDREVCNLQVRKMRRTDIDRAYHHLDFTDEGLVVKPEGESQGRNIRIHHHRNE